MKKSLGLLLTLGLLLGCLAGCGADAPETPVRVTEAPVGESVSTPETAGTPDVVLPAGQTAVPETMPLRLTASYGYPSYTENDRWLCGGRCVTLAPAENAGVPTALREAMRAFMDAAASYAQSAVDAAAPAARAARASDPENFTYIQLDTRVLALRADTRAVSVLQVNTADGAESYACATWDTQSGAPLALADIVTDAQRVPALLAEQLHLDEAALRERMAEEDGTWAWNLGYQGLTFRLFSVETVLPFKAYPELYNAQYTAVPTAYVVPFTDTLAFDLNGDGTCESITVKPVEDDFGNYTGVIAAVDGVAVTKEDWCYELTPYLLYGGAGNVCLYVETRTDNDYRSIDIFRLGFAGPETLGDFFGGFADVPCDPREMTFDKRCALLSTYGGTRCYALGADGKPEAIDAWYKISAEAALTSKVALNVALVDEGGTALGEHEVPAGSRFAFVRTDAESWVDMRLDDGSLCRLSVVGVWPQTVNGLDLEETFDGTFFAG